MNFEFWKRTGVIKPFESIEEWEQYTEDCCKLPSLESFVNSPMKKSKIRKGIAAGDKFDSFSEFVMKCYFTKIKGYVVERNHIIKLPYMDNSGKQRNYIPDFTVNGIFYEVKGRFTTLDQIKQASHPEVHWIFQEEINQMKKELNEQYPGWDTDFIQTN
jgi:hypothetical protein